MATNGMCFLCLIFLTSNIFCIKVLEEPVCTSRFDFESGLVREMMKLEFEVAQLKDQTKLALTKLEMLSNTLNNEHTSKLEEFTALAKDIREEAKENTLLLEEEKENMVKDFAHLNKKADAKLDEITALGKDIRKDVEEKLVKDFATMNTEFEIKANTKWQAIEAQAVKQSVPFLAHTVSDKSPGAYTKLTFTVAVTNTGDAYDTSTGVFTAPVNGTFWFCVQICMYTSKYIQVQIYAENKVIGNSFMYDHGQTYRSCSTTSAVSVLTAGNKVYVKTGGSVSSDDVIYQDSARWSFFSGALVN